MRDVGASPGTLYVLRDKGIIEKAPDALGRYGWKLTQACIEICKQKSKYHVRI